MISPFAPGTTTQPIDVAVKGDTELEPTEWFTVELSGAQNALIADAHGTGWIITDEGAASDQFADAAPLGTVPTPYSTSFATVEVGEPGLVSGPTFGPRSVWFQVAPGRGGLALHTTANPSGPFQAFTPGLQLSVYRGGALNTLTLVARATTHNFPNAAQPGESIDLTFLTEASGPFPELYFIQIVSASPSSTPRPDGGLSGTLSQTFYPAPANDDYARAQDIGDGQYHLDSSFAKES